MTEKILRCEVCKGSHTDDLTHGRGEVRNVVCHSCGGHYYKGRWWTKAEWLAYVEESV